MDEILSYSDSIDRDTQQLDLKSLLSIATERGHDIDLCRISPGVDRCLSIAASKYPTASTSHEIAKQAIGTDDRDTIRQLVSIQGYLPIRWDAFLPDASGTIISIILNGGRFTLQGRVEAAYRLQDPQLIEQYTQAISLSDRDKIEYAVRFGYIKGIPSTDIRSIVLNGITSTLPLSEYVFALDYALGIGRTDIVDAILDQYSQRSSSQFYDDNTSAAIQLLSLAPNYNMIVQGQYSSVPRNTMNYLLQFNYVQVSDSIRAIILDDISILDNDDISNIKILSISEISLMIQYDSINLWRLHRDNISLSQLSHLLENAHGDIRREILLSLSNGRDTIINSLLPHATSVEMDEMLSLHLYDNEYESLRLDILSTAAHKGYIEILDKYLTENNMYKVLSSERIYPQLDMNRLQGIANLLNYKYRDTHLHDIGTQIFSIWYSIGTYVPNHIWERYLAAAIVAGNVPLVSGILKQFNISEHIKDRARLLIRQSHMTNVPLYRELMRLFQ